ncbi:MAG TPA: OFA family MFS transporter [Gemmatimonadaceae bacterium]|nr:OFA family MFS transporter [Gemmatimonadaceae bacterium]
MAFLSFLDRERIVAKPGFNRWLVPPAALAIHLCIGQAYAFSVFNKPLAKLVAISRLPHADTLRTLSQSKLVDAVTAAPTDWSIPTITWVFSIAIVCLGLSAATFGAWLDRVGPRKAMFASAVCFSCGFFVGAIGVRYHQFWLLLGGYGVLGGIGLGLGYISPVSTLIKWFPDKPGMATGLAIMGFGGGAMIAAPLSVKLMETFHAMHHGSGVTGTFLTLGLIYLLYMMFGVFSVRIPAPGWLPAGFVPSVRQSKLVSSYNVSVDNAWKTPQFWMLWIMLLVNVTAGIGVLSQASPMSQDLFPGRITAVVAGGFVGLLSIANMAGRFGWSSLSDVIGRKATYLIFFSLGPLLYIAIPASGRAQSVALFVLCCFLILTMYGGGFATIPAYLRDLFGTRQVGAIHGRLLTAWSTAGVLGPALVSYIGKYQTDHGVPKAHQYDLTLYIMAGLLVVGLICDLLVRPVDAKYHDRESPVTGMMPTATPTPEATRG